MRPPGGAAPAPSAPTPTVPPGESGFPLADYLAAARVLALAEVLRYRSGMETTGSPWRIDNSFVSRLARDLVARRPDLDGRIERRRLRTDP